MTGDSTHRTHTLIPFPVTFLEVLDLLDVVTHLDLVSHGKLVDLGEGTCVEGPAVAAPFILDPHIPTLCDAMYRAYLAYVL